MQATGATFWLLNGTLGWQTARDDGVSASAAGLRLAADPAGPLALGAADGSLGGLVLPRYLAISEDGTLYLLDRRSLRIKVFDPERRRFTALETVGGRGTDARQVQNPTNVAVTGPNLYIADRDSRRVVVFDRQTLAIRHIWDAQSSVSTDGWEPVDVVVDDGRGYVLDAANGRVLRHEPGDDRLRVVVAGFVLIGRADRLAIDRNRWINVLFRKDHDDPPRLQVYDQHGCGIPDEIAGDPRGRFDPPALLLDHMGRFCVPASLAKTCDRHLPDPPAPEAPLAGCAAGPDRLIFDLSGKLAHVDPDELRGPPLYATEGAWISTALDSQRYRCQWHRIELDISSLPPETRVRVLTCTSDTRLPDEEIANRVESLWDVAFETLGQEERPAWADTGDTVEPEFLIRSREGQFLWLRIELANRGHATPVIDAVRIHYPRESYLAYLPAIYSADDESRWFIERFLAIFQTTWDGLEATLDSMAALFDPDAVPDEFLPWLASWLALPLERRWSVEQQRRLLSAAPEIYPHRGTLDALRAWLRVYLENMTSQEIDDESGYPAIVEGFRERQWLMLGQETGTELGTALPLWGPGMIGRLQLDVFAEEGEVRLISTGSPEGDIFDSYAHRFRVFVPSSWVGNAVDEQMLRRAIEAEKPAHAIYDLCLVEPRFQLDFQSTLGLDTIIGDYPLAYLASPDDTNIPPSRQPRNLLGYDTILAASPDTGPQLRLTPGTRVGMDTVLT